MYQIETQLGSFVTWAKHDEDSGALSHLVNEMHHQFQYFFQDVAKGDVGEVKSVKVEDGRLSVRFPKGTNFLWILSSESQALLQEDGASK